MDERKIALLHFAALLRKYREGLGHRNAHSFFTAQGGRGFFGCTYRAYLYVEKGLSVPSPALVEKLVATLWIAVDEPRAREFSSAYLSVLLGMGDFAAFIADGLAERPAGRPAGPG